MSFASIDQIENYEEELDEPLLNDKPLRQTLIYPNIWDFYKKLQSANWTAEEVRLDKDVDDWKKLNDGERGFIAHVLAFFTASDGIVNKNLIERFLAEVKAHEARCFYGFQIMIQNVHAEMYSRLIEALIVDLNEQYNMFHAIENVDCIKKKADWALRWINDVRASFGERLVALAAIESIFNSGGYASIFWLKSRGVMPGLCHSNELITRDVGLHREFSCVLYRDHLKRRPSRERVNEIVAKAVEIEQEFIKVALPCSLLGMNAQLMCEYIEYVADNLLLEMGLEAIYKTPNPFAFMLNISIEGNTNFFERRVTEYKLRRGMSAASAVF